MRRRAVLEGLGAGSVALAVALAGCSGDGDDGDDGGDGGDPSGPPGELVGSQIDEITVTDHRAITAGGPDAPLEVEITARNDGDQPTVPIDYTYELTLYGPDGEDVTGRVSSVRGADEETAPGESDDLVRRRTLAEGAETVDRYELRVNCSGIRAEGAYCPEG